MLDKQNMTGLIGWIIRNKRIVAIGILIATLLLGFAMIKVVLNADFSTYLRQSDPVVQTFNYVGKKYAGKSMGLVLIQADDVFNTETLKLIKDLTDAYEELDGVAYVTSLTNVLDFKKTEWGLEVGRLIQSENIPRSDEELKRLRDYVLSKELYVNDLLSQDGKLAVIAVRFKHGVYEFAVTGEVKRVTEAIASNPEQISYGGLPFMIYHMTLNILGNMKYLEPLMIFLMLAILFIGFRRAGGVFVPLLVVAFSVIWTVGLMAIFGISLNMLTGIMPVILVAMGSADGIHIMKRYYEKRRTIREPSLAIRETFSELGSPVIITTLTTTIGFLSLLISNFSVIKQFGLVTSIGIFFALMATFLFIPVLLAFSKPKTEKQHNIAKSGRIAFLDRWAEMVFRRKAIIVLLTGFIVILSGIMLPRIKKSVDWSLCLKRGSKAHRAEMLLRRYFGGTVPVQTLVNGDLKDPFTLKAMRYLERYLETVPFVGQTQSMASVISEMNAAMNDRYVVPETKDGVANLWLFIEDEEIMEQMVNEDQTEGLVTSRLATWDTGILVEALEKIERFTKALPRKIFVVNLGEVPDGVREVLLGIRAERITDNLMRDLLKRKIEVDGDRLNSNIRKALLSQRLEASDKSTIEKRVVNYLLSEEAEIESVSETEAARIAGGIVSEMEGSGAIGREQILALIQSETEQVAGEDMDELAQSLEEVVRVAAGEAKVDSLFAKLKEILPLGAEGARGLSRDLRGDLWEMNEDLMALGVNDFRGTGLAAVPEKIKEIPVSFESTGLASVLKRMEEELIPSQVQSLLIALVLTAITMALIFRSAIVGVIGMIPISLTILINFALMAYLRIGLDSFTAMVASVAIGLGIDTDVHFISCIKREFSRLGDELQALKKTLSTTGVAILINALTVGLGFMVLLFAGGQHVRRFGGLVALTVILSATFTFTVLPAVIMLFKSKFFKREKKK